MDGAPFAAMNAELLAKADEMAAMLEKQVCGMILLEIRHPSEWMAKPWTRSPVAIEAEALVKAYRELRTK